VAIHLHLLGFFLGLQLGISGLGLDLVGLRLRSSLLDLSNFKEDFVKIKFVPLKIKKIKFVRNSLVVYGVFGWRHGFTDLSSPLVINIC
jgi:hypothetical protein